MALAPCGALSSDGSLLCSVLSSDGSLLTHGALHIYGSLPSHGALPCRPARSSSPVLFAETARSSLMILSTATGSLIRSGALACSGSLSLFDAVLTRGSSMMARSHSGVLSRFDGSLNSFGALAPSGSDDAGGRARTPASAQPPPPYQTPFRKVTSQGQFALLLYGACAYCGSLALCGALFFVRPALLVWRSLSSRLTRTTRRSLHHGSLWSLGPRGLGGSIGVSGAVQVSRLRLARHGALSRWVSLLLDGARGFCGFRSRQFGALPLFGAAVR